MANVAPGRPGAVDWLRRHLFSTPLNGAITVVLLLALGWLLPKVFGWAVWHAVWGAAPVAACDAVRGTGACWAVVWEKFRFMMFGVYPFAQKNELIVAYHVLARGTITLGDELEAFKRVPPDRLKPWPSTRGLAHSGGALRG